MITEPHFTVPSEVKCDFVFLFLQWWQSTPNRKLQLRWENLSERSGWSSQRAVWLISLPVMPNSDFRGPRSLALCCVSYNQPAGVRSTQPACLSGSLLLSQCAEPLLLKWYDMNIYTLYVSVSFLINFRCRDSVVRWGEVRWGVFHWLWSAISLLDAAKSYAINL